MVSKGLKWISLPASGVALSALVYDTEYRVHLIGFKGRGDDLRGAKGDILKAGQKRIPGFSFQALVFH